MPTPGKLELTIKINEMPADVETVENGWKEFDLDCDGQLAAIAKRCCEAQIAGKMGEPLHGGFVLDQPNIQVFERKPKEPKLETASA
jgi:hypothetical protein